MRKLVIAVLILVSAAALSAQQPKPDKAPNNDFSWAQAPYRLDFVVKELDGGKVINSRQYSMIVEASDRLRGLGKGVVKSGDRVPVATGSKDGNTQIQYIDVGANIDASLYTMENGLMLMGSIEISAIAPNEVPGSQNLPDPAIRQVRAEVQAEVFPGKSNQIALLDDMTSKHRFIVEVTPTKLK
ncbi:MAG: hypothetical protein ACRD3E_14385 [Terriglobales bacterium]